MATAVADLGPVVGAPGATGPQGEQGPDGLTAFQAAVLYEGYTGTEEQLYKDIADIGAVRDLLRQLIGEEVPTE